MLVPYDLSPSRAVEYMFIVKRLPEYGKLLDVGCLESNFIYELAEDNNYEVWAIDIRDFDVKGYPIKFVKGDIQNTPFDDSMFDIVTAISTIEHVGLIHYENKKLNVNGDIKAINEIKRVLKNDGVALVTVEVGIESSDWFRCYTTETINRLTEGWTIKEMKWFKKERDSWDYVECESEDASKKSLITRHGKPNRPQACVCMVLKKC